MVRKMMLAAVTAMGVMAMTGGTAQANGYHGSHHGGHHGGYHHGAHRYGYGPRFGVVVAPRVIAPPVYPYPVYPSYPVYAPPVYAPPVYAPAYGAGFGLQTGNFSMYLGR